LREEGYFQTGPLIPATRLDAMRGAVEAVRAAGFPPMFALVYDVFYEAFADFDGILAGVLGRGYQLIPNFWVYHIESSDQAKGFEPHRDAEYADTIGPDGMPTVLTLWVAVTDATPLNSCMYIVPRNRDPQYSDATRNRTTPATQFKLEDIRALPARAGTLSCWDQYVYHWGSRGSRRAPSPRISYAAYCQRGDIPPVGDRLVPLPSPFAFRERLSLICRGLYRYSYVQRQRSEEAGEVRAFLEKHM
jgi:Phytanoyl-CoA dioxygenase (PhyH)